MKPLNAIASPLLAIPASNMVFGVSISWWKNSPSLAKVYDVSPVVSFQNRIVDFCAVARSSLIVNPTCAHVATSAKATLSLLVLICLTS